MQLKVLKDRLFKNPLCETPHDEPLELPPILNGTAKPLRLNIREIGKAVADLNPKIARDIDKISTNAYGAMLPRIAIKIFILIIFM